MAGTKYFTSAGELAPHSHLIADAIYERITGEKGYFDTVSSSSPNPAPR